MGGGELEQVQGMSLELFMWGFGAFALIMVMVFGLVYIAQWVLRDNERRGRQ